MKNGGAGGEVGVEGRPRKRLVRTEGQLTWAKDEAIGSRLVGTEQTSRQWNGKGDDHNLDSWEYCIEI